MSEFCAGVKILLERMKSNPEDFELIEHDMPTLESIKGRFYQFAVDMEHVILGTVDKERPWKEWQYFTEEERQALIDGFKEMKRTKFDKKIMERVFDEKFIERQRAEMQLRRYSTIQPLHVNPAQQIQPGTFITTTDGTNGGLMGAIGLGLGGVFK